MDLHDAIQKIAVKPISYGRPHISAELHRRSQEVNPKRVYRLMREDNLLCVQKVSFAVTTDSNHTRKSIPTWRESIVLTANDQLWRGDNSDFPISCN